jgi:glyceraldehyde 3-phosphate dehydrogenase
MAIKVAINGFGRIGRITYRAMLQKSDIEVVAINDLTDVKTLAHLFKYDSAQGTFAGKVDHAQDQLIIKGKKVDFLSEKDPTQLPWDELGVDVVLESTGIFRKRPQAAQHIEAGADKVIISAPAKGDDPVKTIVLGVNDDQIEDADKVLSNASCTTNSLAPMVKILDDNWGVNSGFMTTVHAYTANQQLQDGPHKDLRRARAAAQNIVPTTTGAAKAVGEVMPEIEGKLDGMAMRVPTIDGSITDLTCELEDTPTEEDINEAFRSAAEGAMNGIIEYCETPLVSSDIIGNPHSCIFDAEWTRTQGNLVKVVGWYDNEAGYSHRLADLITKIG